jgi:hypothetical protein
MIKIKVFDPFGLCKAKSDEKVIRCIQCWLIFSSVGIFHSLTFYFF